MTNRPEPRTRTVYPPCSTFGESVCYTREFFIEEPDDFWGEIVEKLVPLASMDDQDKEFFDPMRNEDPEDGYVLEVVYDLIVIDSGATLFGE